MWHLIQKRAVSVHLLFTVKGFVALTMLKCVEPVRSKMSKCLKDFIGVVMDNATVFSGSNLDVLPFMADNSVDSIVTDPPYELGFMGKSWDNSGIAYSVELWTECMRVLKPGGHLLAFGGSRTWHRLAVAIEDAGFEMRDSIAWIYGSGFPKSLNISKAIESTLLNGSSHSTALRKTEQDGHGASYQLVGKNNGILGETRTYDRKEFTAGTEEAQYWEGWGTALKPAFEPVVVARKPLIGTVANNVLEYGTGGLNIDASRISRKEGDNSSAGNRTATFGTQETLSGGDGSGGWEQNAAGRWPANVMLDEDAAGLLDEQSGISTSGKSGIRTSDGFNANAYGSGIGIKAGQNNGEYGDTGGASRFFYVAKASKKDRNEGLDNLPTKGKVFNGQNPESAGMADGSVEDKFTTKPAQNFHPTVKPTTLMEYLIKLVTPVGGTVLDPFTGSGSTGKAALLNGFSFIGIELTKEYLPIIEGRLKWATEQAIKQEEEKKEVLF
jgi:DNA modification methylase